MVLEDVPMELADLVAQLAAGSAVLGKALHPTTAANLAQHVRIMNCYYSNLIEGHHTRPRDIESAWESPAMRQYRDAKAETTPVDAERAHEGVEETVQVRRDLQREAVAHMQVQGQIDDMAVSGKLQEPAAIVFIQWLHRTFYDGVPAAFLKITNGSKTINMRPGEFRSHAGEDNAVGRHVPPSHVAVPSFMARFSECYRMEGKGQAAQILAIAASHHRFNYVHPFPDGNGRVSRLMSHAMAHKASIGAHGLWSISRGLARGLNSRQDYKKMMDHADSPRQGDLDGRGNLSHRALVEFTRWFLSACLDQVTFMSGLFALDTLGSRICRLVERSETLQPEAAPLLTQILVRGEIDRGEVTRITGRPERTARRILSEVMEAGLVSSPSPRGRLHLRFPVSAAETLFPQLYPET